MTEMVTRFKVKRLQSTVCILPSVCILFPASSLESALRSLRFTLTASEALKKVKCCVIDWLYGKLP